MRRLLVNSSAPLIVAFLLLINVSPYVRSEEIMSVFDEKNNPYVVQEPHPPAFEPETAAVERFEKYATDLRFGRDAAKIARSSKIAPIAFHNAVRTREFEVVVPAHPPSAVIHDSVFETSGGHVRVNQLLPATHATNYRPPPPPVRREIAQLPRCSFETDKWAFHPQSTITMATMFERSTGVSCEECLRKCERRQKGLWTCRSVVFDSKWGICDLFAIKATAAPYYLVDYAERDYFEFLTASPPSDDEFTNVNKFAMEAKLANEDDQLTVCQNLLQKMKREVVEAVTSPVAPTAPKKYEAKPLIEMGFGDVDEEESSDEDMVNNHLKSIEAKELGKLGEQIKKDRELEFSSTADLTEESTEATTPMTTTTSSTSTTTTTTTSTTTSTTPSTTTTTTSEPLTSRSIERTTETEWESVEEEGADEHFETEREKKRRLNQEFYRKAMLNAKNRRKTHHSIDTTKDVISAEEFMSTPLVEHTATAPSASKEFGAGITRSVHLTREKSVGGVRIQQMLRSTEDVDSSLEVKHRHESKYSIKKRHTMRKPIKHTHTVCQQGERILMVHFLSAERRPIVDIIEKRKENSSKDCANQCRVSHDCSSSIFSVDTCQLSATRASHSRQELGPSLVASYFEKVCIDELTLPDKEGTMYGVANHRLIGYVEEVEDALTVEECIESCFLAKKRHGFTCLSVMWYPLDRTQNCLLNSQSRLTQPKRFLPEEDGLFMVYFELSEMTVNKKIENMDNFRRDAPPRTSKWTYWSSCDGKMEESSRFRYLKCSEQEDVRLCPKETAFCGSSKLSGLVIHPLDKSS